MPAPRDPALTQSEHLLGAIVGPGGTADFEAANHGGLVLLTPLHDKASAWLHACVEAEAMWSGAALVLEQRWFPALAEAIIDAGFKFGRNASPV